MHGITKDTVAEVVRKAIVVQPTFSNNIEN
jgi:hypothetical protein